MDMSVDIDRAAGKGGGSSPLNWLRGVVAEIVPPGIALIVILVGWEAVVRLANVPIYLLPAPSAMFVKFLAIHNSLLQDAGVTLLEALVGLAIGSTVGVALGTLVARSVFMERLVYPVAVTIRATPFIAIAPLFILWFGFTLMPKALVAALACFFPMLSNSIVGLRSVDATALEFFQSVRASPRQVFWRLRVPTALPYLFASLRLCVSMSLIGAVVGELVGARAGLGFIIDDAAQNLLTPTIFSAVALLTLMGVVLSELVVLVESRVLFWHESQRQRT